MAVKHKQTDRQTGRQTGRQTHTHSDRHTHTHTQWEMRPLPLHGGQNRALKRRPD